MGIALLAISSLSQPMRALTRWISRTASVAAAGPSMPRTAQPPCHSRSPDSPTATRPEPARPAAMTHLGRAGMAGHAAANADSFAHLCAAPHAGTAQRQAARTVRVLHRADGPGPHRLVISGRMADVCAELDRLVAFESRQH